MFLDDGSSFSYDYNSFDVDDDGLEGDDELADVDFGVGEKDSCYDESARGDDGL